MSILSMEMATVDLGRWRESLTMAYCGDFFFLARNSAAQGDLDLVRKCLKTKNKSNLYSYYSNGVIVLLLIVTLIVSM